MKNPTFRPVKIAVLGSRGIPNRYGGFEEMAQEVCPRWVAAGHHVVVYATSDHPEKVENFENVEIRHIFNPEKSLGLAGQFIYDLLCLRDAQKEDFDVILQLGYTTSALWSFLWPKHKTITNMDGLEHQRAKYQGPLAGFLRWSERRAANSSQLLVADNPEIANFLEKYKTPKVTIAYGTAVVEQSKELDATLENWSKTEDLELKHGEYHVHIGRVQKDNHVREILEAARISGQTLIAIGDYTKSYGKLLKETYQRTPNIHFVGAIYDKAVLNALRTRCKFYIHGHSAGGTNPALLEAMGCGAFVLAHGNRFNASVLGGLGGLWTNAQELADMLRSNPNEALFSEQQKLARERMSAFFDWSSIANQYLEIFLPFERK